MRSQHLPVLFAFFIAGAAGAQPPSPSVTDAVRVFFTVRPVLAVSVDREVIDMGDLPPDRATSFRSPVPVSIRVQANTPWTMSASISDTVVRSARTGAAPPPAEVPSLRLENIVPGRVNRLASVRSIEAQVPLVSGTSTGSQGLTVRPDLIVDVPAGTAPGTYRFRLLIEVKAQP